MESRIWQFDAFTQVNTLRFKTSSINMDNLNKSDGCCKVGWVGILV